MSASLFILIPSALLAVVFLLCFVGCGFDLSGQGVAQYQKYYAETILPTPELLAFWPLSEPAGATTIIDVKSGHNGTYTNTPPFYISLGKPGLLPGDTAPPYNDPNARTTCMETNGEFVTIPIEAAFVPTKAEGFTLEAWVRVEWGSNVEPTERTVVHAYTSDSGMKGFWLFATPDNRWAAAVGNGAIGDAGKIQATGAPLVLGTTNHLVATYDGNDLRLYVNGGQSSPTTPADYHPITTAESLHIGMNFAGKMQCVALYKGALTLETIIKHYHNGNGFDLPTYAPP
jgi:hypothetical protein